MLNEFISTLVFILPGFMMYFWIQSFGVNSVTKHSSSELTVIAALLWLPVSTSTLLIYNLFIKISSSFTTMKYIWTLNDLKKVYSNLIFLISFLIISAVVSFILGVIYSKWIYQLQRNLINNIRKWRGVAPFSNSPSVWDEVFLSNDAQVIEIGKIDSKEKGIIGEIKKVSRTFEPERSLLLNHVEYFTNKIANNDIPIVNIFIDINSGTYIKIFDSKKISEIINNK